MDLHKILNEQLKENQLDENTLPNSEQWHHLLSQISQHLHDMEYNQYLMKRSMEMINMDIQGKNQQVVASARRAGMADVATAILHNVGNVLNSVNVSLGLIRENLTSDNLERFITIIKMIRANKEKLAEFFSQDERGKHIPEYLENLLQSIISQYEIINKEFDDLTKQVSHIRDITGMQKEISGMYGVIEKVYIPEVVDSAIKMSNQGKEDNNIELIKKIDNTLFISTDKSKLLQIIVNLLHNAKDAVNASNKQNKKIEISVVKNPDNKTISIILKDNGVGISKENLIKIFSFGFTTKVTGHGFGLHSSALAARELGGQLEVTSFGKNKGSTFTLTIPLKFVERSSHGKEKQEYADYSDR